MIGQAAGPRVIWADTCNLLPVPYLVGRLVCSPFPNGMTRYTNGSVLVMVVHAEHFVKESADHEHLGGVGVAVCHVDSDRDSHISTVTRRIRCPPPRPSSPMRQAAKSANLHLRWPVLIFMRGSMEVVWSGKAKMHGVDDFRPFELVRMRDTAGEPLSYPCRFDWCPQMASEERFELSPPTRSRCKCLAVCWIGSMTHWESTS